eukprot:1161274-Pelagomonas_calceolata.AAC.1
MHWRVESSAKKEKPCMEAPAVLSVLCKSVFDCCSVTAGCLLSAGNLADADAHANKEHLLSIACGVVANNTGGGAHHKQIVCSCLVSVAHGVVAGNAGGGALHKQILCSVLASVARGVVAGSAGGGARHKQVQECGTWCVIDCMLSAGKCSAWCGGWQCWGWCSPQAGPGVQHMPASVACGVEAGSAGGGAHHKQVRSFMNENPTAYDPERAMQERSNPPKGA